MNLLIFIDKNDTCNVVEFVLTLLRARLCGASPVAVLLNLAGISSCLKPGNNTNS